VIDLPQFKVLTFDCYGTLIDWEAGILAALRPVFSAYNVCTTDDQVLELYGQIESEIEAQGYQPYRTVLQKVVGVFSAQLDFRASLDDLNALVNSIRQWPPFPDTVDALKRLKKRYRLGIISNIDSDLLKGSLQQLKVDFDFITTAEDARAYKPSPAPFQMSLSRIGVPQSRILHVAQSLYHDHVPARALGFSTVWINRRQAVEGGGATPPAEAIPDLEFPDLQSFADAAGV
jgi:2-haloacid dehalogenase